jgi:hypothetical protein
VKKRCQNAQKMVKKWLRFKTTKLKFDGISLTDESPVDEENLI